MKPLLFSSGLSLNVLEYSITSVVPAAAAAAALWLLNTLSMSLLLILPLGDLLSCELVAFMTVFFERFSEMVRAGIFENGVGTGAA